MTTEELLKGPNGGLKIAKKGEDIKVYECKFCGIQFTNCKEDLEGHLKIHKRKQLAEKVFGHIANYREREFLKQDYAYTGNGVCDSTVVMYAHWCRSVEGCNYDLMHPTLQEYAMHYKKNDCDWLGDSTYVNMQKYKRHINQVED